jgi:hypothetical protein
MSWEKALLHKILMAVDIDGSKHRMMKNSRFQHATALY